MKPSGRKHFLIFVFKFIFLYLFFYYGTLLIIGLSSPGGFYNQLFHDYFNFVSWLKISLIKGATVIANIFGYTTKEEPGFLLHVVNGRGVIIAYDCVGYGVMSFWAAFIIASSLSFKKKLVWLFGGLLLLWLINVCRIGLFLVALNKGWDMPLGLDHHAWFNIFAYTAILFLMFLFDKSLRKPSKETY